MRKALSHSAYFRIDLRTSKYPPKTYCASDVDDADDDWLQLPVLPSFRSQHVLKQMTTLNHIDTLFGFFA